MSPHTYDPNTPEGRRIAKRWEAIYRQDHPKEPTGWGSMLPVLRDLLIVAVVFLAMIGVMYLPTLLSSGH